MSIATELRDLASQIEKVSRESPVWVRTLTDHLSAVAREHETRGYDLTKENYMNGIYADDDYIDPEKCMLCQYRMFKRIMKYYEVDMKAREAILDAIEAQYKSSGDCNDLAIMAAIQAERQSIVAARESMKKVMRCERCQGEGRVVVWTGIQLDGTIVRPRGPCPDCNGSGIASCCDGACGDRDEAVAPWRSAGRTGT